MEGAQFENDIRHGPGLPRTMKRFGAAWLRELAMGIETEFQGRFEAHGARLAVSPLKVSGLTTVGEGVALVLIPRDPKAWDYWGDFESELEVRRRRRFSGEWQHVTSAEDTETWVRSEADRYLRHLDGGAGASA